MPNQSILVLTGSQRCALDSVAYLALAVETSSEKEMLQVNALFISRIKENSEVK